MGYVLSRFPKITETFILYEMLELRRIGIDVTIHAIVRQRTGPIHPEAQPLIADVTFGTDLLPLLGSQAYWLARRPIRYLASWVRALRGNLRSPRFLIRAAVTVPVAAHFARRMREARVEHVHAHWATHPTLAAMLAAGLLDVPFSFTAHAHDLYVNRTMLGEKIAAASFVATISEYNQRLLEGLYPAQAAGKTAVIRCGVDLAMFARTRQKARADPWRIVCVASLEPQKGHRILIEAIGIMRAEGLAVECRLIGDGPEAGNLRRLVGELSLGDAVQFLGPRTRQQVLAQLSDADAMALASLPTASGKMEGIPVALMEGMAMRLPVVATNISGIPELVVNGVTGLLAPPGNARALADALIRLHGDEALARRLGAAARRHVERHFALAPNARLLAAAFSGSVGRARRD